MDAAFGKGNQDENDIAAKYENLEKTNSCNDQNRRKPNASIFSYHEQTDTPNPTEKSIPEEMAAVAAMVEEKNLGNRKQEATDAPNPTEEDIPKDMAAPSAVGKERKIPTAQIPVLGHLLPEEYAEYHQQYLAQVEELHYQQYRAQVEGQRHFILQTQLQARLRNISNQRGRGTGVYHPIVRGTGVYHPIGRGGRGGPYGRGAQPHGEHK